MKCFVVVFAIIASAVAESEPWLAYGGYGYGGLGLGYAGAYAAPALAAAAVPAAIPAVPAVPAAVSTASVIAKPGVPSTSQYRKGDEFGNEQFGYDNINSARTEGGNPALGVVTGTIVNKAHGSVLNYVADAAGFRIVGSSNALLGRKKRGVPATKYVIQYNPGFSTGYMVIPALGY